MPRSTTKIWVIEWWNPDLKIWQPFICEWSHEDRAHKRLEELTAESDAQKYRITAFIPAPTKRKAKKK